ncbi:Glycosyltransferase [hydrothermal vent metagenome]|uniref:Glycosyltransferase n=1 Tax=hydrothermal vent metagenome TaxID=652676 RepID=A0A3B1CHR1_9ZZZZ
MKILLAHNYYQIPGGEDVVLEKERALLASHGNDAPLFTVNNDEIKRFIDKLETAWNAPYNRRSKNMMAQKLATLKPDIVHAHNFFPVLSPSIYDACQEAGVPVVQTLHNFRILCPGALFMRGGKVCEDCLESSPYQAVFHKCYRESRFGSLVVARMVAKHKALNTWNTKVDRFIALTAFAKSKFVQGGIEPERISVKPNFIETDNTPLPPAAGRGGALFVGRLSVEKGIETLLEAWKNIDYKLRIAGDGPLMEKVKNAGIKNITVLGRLSAREVAKEMRRSAFLVAPSCWYEGFPMVLLEAFANGLPVIVSRLGSLAEIVEERVTGIRFTAGDAHDFTEKVSWAMGRPEELGRMGVNARKTFEDKYNPETNYKTLIGIYRRVIEDKGKKL